MLHIIILTFNRAIFLNNLLKSIKKYFNLDEIKITILYNASSENYLQGYEKLISTRFIEDVEFIKESNVLFYKINFNIFYYRNSYRFIRYNLSNKRKSNFRNLLLDQLKTKLPLTMFLTDDSMFYKFIELNPKSLLNIIVDSNTHFFSLRHGRNIIHNVKLTDYDKYIISWNRLQTNIPHWHYSFSIDGHIYKSSILHQLLKKLWFYNPSTLESYVASYCFKENIFQTGFAFKESSLIGFELNRVQCDYDNQNLNIDNQFLNNKFLEDYELNIKFENPICSFRPRVTKVELIKDNQPTIILYHG